MKKKFIALLLITCVVLLFGFIPGNKQPEPYQHSPEELAYFANMRHTPLVPGEWFQTSLACRGCHGHDSLALANVDEDGNDHNLVDRWESSMMALSAKDPLWRAKVSQEITVNPPHEGPLQDKCTSCHAPAGRYNHFYRQGGYFRLTDLVNDSLGLDGVTCVGCHTIDSSVGSTFSGIIPFDTTRQIYGPFTIPFVAPMQLYVGYTPNYATHTDESRMCSSCHTLITETADLSGNLTGGEFIEQATYHEYLNSSYPANNVKCQTCHMPQLPDPQVIANGFINLQPRYPFNQHMFTGANHFMLGLIKDNKAALDVQVPDIHFDSTMDVTADNLRRNSINLNVMFDSAAADTGYFRVKIENKVGHKFPSGYPSRRAVLQFVLVEDATGDTLFRSGLFDSDGRVQNESSGFEPHHDIISTDGTPQIYEIVMGDVNHDFTSVLERAAYQLKDNRIPPLGFTSTHQVYDTVQIGADAFADPDFNKNGAIEGTGIDYVNFHIPLQNHTGSMTVYSRMFYQPVPPKWLDEMFMLSTPEISTFQGMYAAADKAPFLMKSDSINLTITGGIQLSPANEITLNPTVTASGIFKITTKSAEILKVEAFNVAGKKINCQLLSQGATEKSVKLTESAGTYYIRIVTSIGTLVRKVIII